MALQMSFTAEASQGWMVRVRGSVAEKDIQKMTDDMCKEIDELLAKKEQELLAVCRSSPP